jgi:type I restriction enzyme S subunit
VMQQPLPPGWRRAPLADLVGDDGVFTDGDWVESKDQDPDGDVRLIQLADVGDGKYRDRSARFLTRKKAEQLRCTFLKAGDVLVARMPDPLGRACIFPGDKKPSVTVVDVCVVRPKGGAVTTKWLCHALNSPQVRVRVAGHQAGTTRKRISRSKLGTVDLNVPPLADQERLVAEIEKQFTRLDAGVEALKRLRAHLRRYRAAVLNGSSPDLCVKRTHGEAPRLLHAAVATTASFDFSRDMSR